MRVQILPPHKADDRASTSSVIPDRLSHLLYDNFDRSFHSTKQFEYIEQRVELKDCAFCWLDLDVFVDDEALLVVDNPAMGLLYTLHGIISCFVDDSIELVLKQGRSYLYYFPGFIHHRIGLKKGHCRIAYCAVSKESEEWVGLTHSFVQYMFCGIPEMSTMGLGSGNAYRGSLGGSV